MRTRIREFRKRRSLTLKALAEKIGTTPQTVQRLETGSMTVSTKWLDRIADALNVEPAELLATTGSREIPFLGRVGQDGYVKTSSQDQELLYLELSTETMIAVSLEHPTGRYERDSILIASKVELSGTDRIDGEDCLVKLQNGEIFLCRIFHSGEDGYLFAPLEPGESLSILRDASWMAKIVMSIRYF